MDFSLLPKMKIKLMKSKSGAMEMSMGTMVIIVLSMIVLVLGIFFIQKIFSAGTNAIDTIDTQIQSEMQKLFSSDDARRVVMFPTSQRLKIKQGAIDEGFAFSLKNLGSETESFTFEVIATDTSHCPESITTEVATSYLLGGYGSINDLSSGDTWNRLVTFIFSETTPLCTMGYELDIRKGDGSSYGNINFFVTIK